MINYEYDNFILFSYKKLYSTDLIDQVSLFANFIGAFTTYDEHLCNIYLVEAVNGAFKWGLDFPTMPPCTQMPSILDIRHRIRAENAEQHHGVADNHIQAENIPAADQQQNSLHQTSSPHETADDQFQMSFNNTSVILTPELDRQEDTITDNTSTSIDFRRSICS